MDRTMYGACLCGAVRFELDPPSRFCAHCHCQNCRRAHGAAFVTFAGFPKRQVRVTGEEQLVRFLTETGTTRSFCRQCGSTLFCEGPRWADELHVALANLSDPLDREPESNVYVDHKAEWWTIDDALPRYGGKTGVEPKE